MFTVIHFSLNEMKTIEKRDDKKRENEDGKLSREWDETESNSKMQHLFSYKLTISAEWHLHGSNQSIVNIHKLCSSPKFTTIIHMSSEKDR